MPIDDQTRIVPSSDAVVREVNGEAVLLHLETSQYHTLDPISTEIWKCLLDAPSFASALNAVHATFDVELDRLRGDLDVFVEQLAERGLVTLEPGPSGP